MPSRYGPVTMELTACIRPPTLSWPLPGQDGPQNTTCRSGTSILLPLPTNVGTVGERVLGKFRIVVEAMRYSFKVGTTGPNVLRAGVPSCHASRIRARQ